MREFNLNQWIEKFNKGDFNDPSFDTQCKAGWYDWFCNTSSLANKTKKLGTNLKQIIKSKKLNPEKQYVWFKNNCPMVGRLYDDFRIADIETGETVYTITPKSGFDCDNGLGSVWGNENKFDEPLFEGTWKEIKNWFLSE